MVIVTVLYVQNSTSCFYIGELVSEAKLTESSSSGSDTDSTEQHQPQGMNHGRPSLLPDYSDVIINTAKTKGLL